MNTTISQDLSSVTLSDDGGKQLIMGVTSPITGKPFASEREVLSAVAEVSKLSAAWVDVPTSEELLSSRKEVLLARVKELRRSTLYTNITIPFPVDDHEIQFRNDSDRFNISNKVMGAMALILSQAPTTPMTFTDANDVKVTMEAQQLLSAGMAILSEKDMLYYQFADVKDQIAAAEDQADLDAAEAALDLL